jgi:hypothetical protein
MRAMRRVSLSDPDSDKVGVYTADKAEDLLVRRSSGVDYYDGETG